MDKTITIKSRPVLDGNSQIVVGWTVYEMNIYGVTIQVMQGCKFTEAAITNLSDNRFKDADRLQVNDYKAIAQKLAELFPFLDAD